MSNKLEEWRKLPDQKTQAVQTKSLRLSTALLQACDHIEALEDRYQKLRADFDDVLAAKEKLETQLTAAEAVCAAADTHVHYDYCSSNVGCNCEMFDLSPSVKNWRAAKKSQKSEPQG